MRSFLAAAAATAALVTLAPTVASAHEESSSHEESTRDDESTDHDEPTRSLAEILLADSSKDGPDGFDRRPWDYDIVTQAVLLFPDLVAAASNPDAELTVFLPSDAAFRRLVHEITGQWVQGEADVFAAVASLGTDTVKNVLLYHILPAAISYRDTAGVGRSRRRHPARRGDDRSRREGSQVEPSDPDRRRHRRPRPQGRARQRRWCSHQRLRPWDRPGASPDRSPLRRSAPPVVRRAGAHQPARRTRFVCEPAGARAEVPTTRLRQTETITR